MRTELLARAQPPSGCCSYSKGRRGWSSTCIRVPREVSSFRQLHHGFSSFIESNRFTHSCLMVMAQKERKYTTTYKLWCLITSSN